MISHHHHTVLSFITVGNWFVFIGMVHSPTCSVKTSITPAENKTKIYQSVMKKSKTTDVVPVVSFMPSSFHQLKCISCKVHQSYFWAVYVMIAEFENCVNFYHHWSMMYKRSKAIFRLTHDFKQGAERSIHHEVYITNH